VTTPIQITVRNNVRVPDVELTRTFSMSTSYQGTTIDATETTPQTNNRDRLSTVTEVTGFTVQEIDFYPRNEGQSAIYSFTMIAPV
jgi:hypothetical protein